MRSIVSLAAMAAALLCTTPARAWESHTDADSCTVGQTFEDGTTVIFMQTKPWFDKKMIAIGMSNPAWSIVKDQKIAGDFAMRTLEGSSSTNRYVEANADHSLYTATSEELFQPFVHTDGVSVFLDGKKIFVGGWTGFYTTYLQFEACRRKNGWMAERKVASDEAERIVREKRYRQNVPVDPFAKPN